MHLDAYYLSIVSIKRFGNRSEFHLRIEIIYILHGDNFLILYNDVYSLTRELHNKP